MSKSALEAGRRAIQLRIELSMGECFSVDVRSRFRLDRFRTFLLDMEVADA